MARAGVPLVALLLLLVVGLFATDTLAAKRMYCCTEYTNGKIPFWAIKGYSLQSPNGMCRIHAIIFHTRKALNICTNPREHWVMDYVSRMGTRAHSLSVNKTRQS